MFKIIFRNFDAKSIRKNLEFSFIEQPDGELKDAGADTIFQAWCAAKSFKDKRSISY